MRLIVLTPGGVGDYLLMRQHLKAVACERPQWKIVWVLSEACKGLANELDGQWLYKVIWIRYGRLCERLYRVWVATRLRFLQSDVILCPSLSRQFWVDWLVYRSGAQERVGSQSDLSCIYADDLEITNRWYTQLTPVTSKFPMFEWERNREFFERWLHTKLPNHEPIELMPSIAGAEGSYAVICPGAGHSSRRWSPEKFSAVAKHIFDHGIEQILVLGSKSDRSRASEIEACQQAPKRLRNLTGKTTLLQSWRILCGSRLIIAQDSASLHMAALANRPYVCLSNGNDYGRFHPYPDALSKSGIMLYPESFLTAMSCPDYLSERYGKPSTHNINTISVEAVNSTVDDILDRV